MDFKSNDYKVILGNNLLAVIFPKFIPQEYTPVDTHPVPADTVGPIPVKASPVRDNADVSLIEMIPYSSISIGALNVILKISTPQPWFPPNSLVSLQFRGLLTRLRTYLPFSPPSLGA